MRSRCPDPYAAIKKLAGFDLLAGDGHYHEAACHDPHKPGKAKARSAAAKSNGERARQAKKLQTGHLILLDMRSHHPRQYTLAQVRPGGGNEHDMHALKHMGARALRLGVEVGRKVMTVWDRAGIDFGFWEEAKRLGVYFTSREKANMRRTWTSR